MNNKHGFNPFRSFYLVAFIFISVSCSNSKHDQEKKEKLFSLLDSEISGVDFINQLDQTDSFNVYLYRNFYNGAGVGLGDFNNDGLTDIYFCGNQVDNKLYINKGNLKFKEIAEKSGVHCPDVWSTGVSIMDINGDGFLDIYVCKSGNPKGENRHNELFINNGDLTFTEKAKAYGIADKGLSSHAAFFDYDKDGDLDCYLLNNSFKSIDKYELIKDQRLERDPEGGNKLYRNDSSHFTDVSDEAGIYGSIIGFGLGVTVGDIDKDGWQDIYVSNDFFEKDYLYINQHDGTFKECLEQQISATSMGAMGADLADINNDGYPDIYVTEMLPEGNVRMKTKAVFATWEEYQFSLKQGYFHQFARNTLQLNNGNNTFSEIGRLAGVSASDWSWGALFADLDNNGYKDIYVANGIYRDLLDQDYLNYYSDPQHVRDVIMKDDEGILSLIEKMPSVKIPNCAFSNSGNLSFSDSSMQWGLATPSHSNGSAYGDLDNDGDLDLVVNNVNMEAFVYENHSDRNSKTNYLTVKLKGDGLNTDAIGAQVTLYAGDKLFYLEKMPMRGFMSAVDQKLHFGLGAISIIDSMKITWPNLRQSLLKGINANQMLTINQNDAGSIDTNVPVIQQTIFVELTDKFPATFEHKENEFVDFNRNKLLFHMNSSEGPKFTIGDVNGDNKDDFYICGAKGQAGALMVQSANGFISTNKTLFKKDQISEETDCIFFDADGDGDQDLYVACGGNELPSSSMGLIDRLYFNDGAGTFSKSNQILPSFTFVSTSCVRPYDFDQDGDLDLFIGVRLKPFFYGIDESSFLMENDGHGNFKDITLQKAKELKNIGMVTDAKWIDADMDGVEDLIISGEWMPIELFINENGRLIKSTEAAGLSHTNGWWNVLETGDFDNDGDIDFVAGNHGLNSSFKASTNHPATLYVNDFDLNGSIEHIICTYKGDTSYPMVLKHDLVKQIPTLASKYPTYDQYKNQRIEDIFPDDILNKSIKKEAFHLESALFVNDGKGHFELIELPVEVQFSPVYSLYVYDMNHDGFLDILAGGNLSRVKPEVGSYMASYGTLLMGNDQNYFYNVKAAESGFSVKGEIRDIKSIRFKNKKLILVAKNDDHFQIFNNE